MDDEDVEALLESSGWGVLSLADGDVPYSLPISYGYDGDGVYFAFIASGPSNRKTEFVAEGTPARLLVTDVRARFDWQSVAVTGPVRAVDRDGTEWERLLESVSESPWFASYYEHAEGVEDIQGWRLDPEEKRGLEVRPDRE